MRRGQQGFTLIELMIVVALIGVLAGLAVVMFGGQKNKAEAKAEVSAMFAEFALRQEQALLEEGSYLSSSASNSESDPHPSSHTTDGSQNSLTPLPTEWVALRMAPGDNEVYCSYVAIVGDGGDDANVGTIASTDFGFTAPATDWYYLLAQCDMDQNSSKDSFYFQSSGDSQMYWINQGK